MKHLVLTSSILATALVCAASFPVAPTMAQAQQVPIPQTASQVPGPAPGTLVTKAYVQAVARMAYIWGWPLVNMANRAAAFSKAPEPGLLGGVVPIAYNRLAMVTGYIAPDQHFITCPNQDVAYGAGFFDLDMEPAVFQVPDFRPFLLSQIARIAQPVAVVAGAILGHPHGAHLGTNQRIGAPRNHKRFLPFKRKFCSTGSRDSQSPRTTLRTDAVPPAAGAPVG
jgi:hypothetical protein